MPRRLDPRYLGTAWRPPRFKNAWKSLAPDNSPAQDVPKPTEDIPRPLRPTAAQQVGDAGKPQGHDGSAEKNAPKIRVRFKPGWVKDGKMIPKDASYKHLWGLEEKWDRESGGAKPSEKLSNKITDRSRAREEYVRSRGTIGPRLRARSVARIRPLPRAVIRKETSAAPVRTDQLPSTAWGISKSISAPPPSKSRETATTPKANDRSPIGASGNTRRTSIVHANKKQGSEVSSGRTKQPSSGTLRINKRIPRARAHEPQKSAAAPGETDQLPRSAWGIMKEDPAPGPAEWIRTNPHKVKRLALPGQSTNEAEQSHSSLPLEASDSLGESTFELETDVIKTSPAKPEAAQPSTVQPKTTQPESMQEGSPQPQRSRAGSIHPKSAQPRSIQFKIFRPEAVHQENTQAQSTQLKATESALPKQAPSQALSPQPESPEVTPSQATVTRSREPGTRSTRAMLPKTRSAQATSAQTEATQTGPTQAESTQPVNPQSTFVKLENTQSPSVQPPPVQPTSAQETYSLLQELFPEEARKQQPPPPPDEHRIIPRLVLDPHDADAPEPPKQKSARQRMIEALKAGRESRWTVLVLRGASKSLAEADFRRMIPKGKHIEEWAGEGDILKVIPHRDPDTLERTNRYTLLFSTPASAHAFQEYDIHALLQAFALVPPSQTLDLRMIPEPYPAPLRRLIEDGGVDRTVPWAEGQEHRVLLHCEGTSNAPTTQAIREGVGWALKGPNGGIVKVEREGKVRERPRRRGRDAAGGRDEGRVKDALSVLEEGWEKEEQTLEATRPQYIATRWLVSFETETEAKRFARTWHRRPLPGLKGFYGFGEPPPLAMAEHIW
ncbi:hypothetical protein H2199_002904 [Coniosporium tulheliwenetii]|uniref:Uncharacterized protein n=1 Tax=Coniosporium tulheliwenetii TaxID=3383036 RepID=A0ACC2ZEN7_9PEZI|nr:hypothetical protein H2199_002904 [Cladosporium sp. JES 115]